MNFRCLLFDLDGTLVDSRADITNSVNLTLTDLGRATLSDETIRLFIGEGVRLLLERALRATQTNEPTDAEVDEALRRYCRDQKEAPLLKEFSAVENIFMESFQEFSQGIDSEFPESVRAQVKQWTEKLTKRNWHQSREHLKGILQKVTEPDENVPVG